MKVILRKSSNRFHFNSLTTNKTYEVIDSYSFGNRNSEYKILNDFDNEIWLDSIHFEEISTHRDLVINKILDYNIIQYYI